MDEFQERYTQHQARKKEILETGFKKQSAPFMQRPFVEREAFTSVLNERRSIRNFNDLPLTREEITMIERAVVKSPSSCNRQAVYIKEVSPETIEQYLVGGKGWVGKAKKVILMFADKDAYKSPNEKAFMPYLDAGFAGQSIYLTCELIGVGACFINPNIREEDKEDFNTVFNQSGDYFCGAFALGKYDRKPLEPPRRKKATKWS